MSQRVVIASAAVALVLAGGHVARAQRPSSPPGTAAEQRLQDRVFVRLSRDSRLGSDIQVQARDGVVTLNGSVTGESARQHAGRLARRTPGVRDVENHLRVADGGPSAATVTTDDPALARRAARQIAAAIPGAKAGEDWWLEGWRVEGPDNRWHVTVESDNGTLWLEGQVPGADVLRTVIETARNVKGVRSVENDLEVESSVWPDGTGYGDAPYGSFPYGYGPRPASEQTKGVR